jgi:hypothetical protein
MYKQFSIAFILSGFLSLNGLGQSLDTNRIRIELPSRLPAIVVNGDTLPYVDLGEVMVVGTRVFKSYDEAIRYYTLVRDVKLVYPYAIMAEATFEQCEETIKTMPDEGDKKHYVKTTEKQIMKQYSEEMKNLTFTQGRLLIKLIDRQTGKTSYEMVKELRGSFSAFMWQTVASLFGNSLKATYDVDGEDKNIESIIHLIEVGAI